MSLQAECARRTAALLRAECAEVLTAEGAAQRAAAYRILRAAQNLETWAYLTAGGRPPRVMDLAASARALMEAAREVCAPPPLPCCGFPAAASRCRWPPPSRPSRRRF